MGQTGANRSQKGANLAAEIASPTTLQTGFQFLTKTSWDSGQLPSTGRVTARDQLPRRDTRHTRDGPACCHPGNEEAETRDVRRCTGCLRRLHLPSTWSPELLGPGKGTKMQAQLSLRLRGLPENLNLSGLDLGSARNPGPASDNSRQSTLEPVL